MDDAHWMKIRQTAAHNKFLRMHKIAVELSTFDGTDQVVEEVKRLADMYLREANAYRQCRERLTGEDLP